MTNRGIKTDLENLLITPEKKCNVAMVLQLLETDERQILEKLLESDVSAMKIAATLRKNNYKVSDSTILRHRRKICVCRLQS